MRDAIAGAIEKTDAQIVFQGFDLKRYGGLGKEKVLGRLPEIQMFSDGAKYLEAEILELGHLMIIYRTEAGWESTQLASRVAGRTNSFVATWAHYLAHD